MSLKPSTAGSPIPAAKKVSTVKPETAPGPRTSRPSQGNTLASMVQALESCELTNQHDLHQFLETNRALAHMLAVTCAMASGELEAQVKAAARAGSGKLGVIGPSMLIQIRRVSKKINRIADSYAGAAADAVGAWAEFQKILDSVEDAQKPRSQRRGFQIIS